jgi:hypothetical protein
VLTVGEGGSVGRVVLPYTLPLKTSEPLGFPANEARRAFFDGMNAQPTSEAAPSAGPEAAGQVSAWTADGLAVLSQKLRVVLQTGPLVAALFVAGSDGKIDDDEVRALEAWFADALTRPGPIAALFPEGLRQMQVLTVGMLSAPIAPGDVLRLVLETLATHVAPAARSAYTGEIRTLARVVAESSRGGGVFAMFRPKVSAQERAMLDALDALLAAVER